jgi:hypothetical protein
MNWFISKNLLNKHLLIYLIFFLSLISFFIGFELRENSAGGGIIDLKHEWHNYNLLKENKLGFLFGNYEASRFPFFHIINIYINPFINTKSDYIFSFFIYSLILIFVFYLCLINVFKKKNKSVIFLLLSILLFSPYFRTSSFWGLQENLAYIFLLLSIMLYEKHNKNIFFIIFVSFLSFYSDQKFIFVPLFFLLKLFNEKQLFSFNNQKLLIYALTLSLPALIIFYLWGGITKEETTSGINESSFRPQNIIFTINIMALYLLPFYILLNYKKKLSNFYTKRNFINISLFIILYIFIRLFFIDINLPVSGGWSFKILILLLSYNYILSEIVFFLISFFSFLLIYFYLNFFIKSIFNKLLLLFLIFFPLSMEIVFQEYFDPLMLFVIIFFIHKDDMRKVDVQKTLIIFLYFFIFWFSALSYYLIV